MKLCRVVGQVWGDIRAPGLEPYKLLEVKRLHFGAEGGLELSSSVTVAVDRLSAGPGDLVLVAHGSRVRDIGLGNDVSTKDVVIAIVDDYALESGAANFSAKGEL